MITILKYLLSLYYLQVNLHSKSMS